MVKIQASQTNAVDKLTRAPSKPKNPLNRIGAGIKKKFSTINLDSGATSNSDDIVAKCESLKRNHCEKEHNCEKNYLLMEKEIKEKYLDSIEACAEKILIKQQTSQLSALQSLHEQESSEAMKRIETDYKEDNEKGSIASISKEDMQRERRTWIVTRGVTEKRKLQVIILFKWLIHDSSTYHDQFNVTLIVTNLGFSGIEGLAQNQGYEQEDEAHIYASSLSYLGTHIPDPWHFQIKLILKEEYIKE